jgi:apolipoprotein D and lipocalin family protein
MGIPKGITPVENFDISRYLGTWYEIARLDHSFERGLSDITATYSLHGNGIKVVNRGCDAPKAEWRTAKGVAYPVKDPYTGYLKVSFFGPFYGSYVVFDLDKIGYQYSFVTGPDRSYLWLLSRTPRIEDEILKKFIREADELGFDTGKLIYVKHGSQSCEMK